jgi:putative oxidoreductase
MGVSSRERLAHKPWTVRRLFSTFAHGPPGVGLLLMRLSAGMAMVVHGVSGLLAGPPLGAGVFEAFSSGLGILLLAGLWTPVAGTLVAADALWNVFSTGHPTLWILLATLGAALALIGPGAWSIDARLFGWRRLEIRDRKSRDAPLDE